MTPKTILTAQATDEPAGHLHEIIKLASHFDAHLNVVVIGLIVPIPATVYGLGVDVVWKERPEKVRRDVEARIEIIEKMTGDAGVSTSVIAEFPEIGSIDRAIVRHALYADLTAFPHAMVLHDATVNEVFEGALHGTGRAALVLGEVGADFPVKRAVVAWDASPEAARAVRECLPFLAPDCEVRIVAVDPQVERTGPNPGSDIASYLARHGLRVEIERLPREGRRVGEVILERADDMDAQLIVMGAFAHPRVRQWLMGGATQDIVSKATTAVLTCH